MAAADVNGNTSGGVDSSVAPKIMLYTNHGCPYAHRAHIALNELGLPFEETLIDLDKPRDPWYLKVNPRGLVPSLKFSNGVVEDEIITESGVVAQFLADMRPSHLLPASFSSPTAPLFRARVKFFIDTWDSKVLSFQYPVMMANTSAEKEAKCKEWIEVIKKEIEPLLANASPYFGGSEKLTLVEVNAAPMVVRWYAISNDKILPAMFTEELNQLPNFSKWAAHLRKHPSVIGMFDAQEYTKTAEQRVEKMRAKLQAK